MVLTLPRQRQTTSPDRGVRIPRLYLPQPLQSGRRIVFANESAHYLRTVLRLKTGATLVIFNGSGGEFSARLAEVNRRRVAADIGEWHDRNAESELAIEVGLGISRGDRMDFAVQKVVELGASRIIPLLTTRCVVRLRSDQAEQKRLHWLKIAQSACEQSGRHCLADVAAPVVLTDWLAETRGLKIIFDPTARQSVSGIRPSQHAITLVTGPEGGFTADEHAQAMAAGFTPVRLGPRTLRAETAAMAAMAAIQTLWGDIGERGQTPPPAASHSPH